MKEIGEPAKCMTIGIAAFLGVIADPLGLQDAAGGGQVRLDHVHRTLIDQILETAEAVDVLARSGSGH